MSVYSLWTIQLENLKTYIKTNLVNKSIRVSKLLGNTSIIFDQKLDKSL